MDRKTVVITGAGGGIGAALAKQYASAGYNLSLLDINKGAADETTALCVALGVGAIALECDVTSLEACDAAIMETLAKFRAVDVLIANAGVTHLSLFEETDVTVLRRVMEVNFFGAVNITKSALPELLKSQGQIIAMSSVAGFCPLPMRTGYAASKYAVRGFFETLRSENRHRGLDVLVVCPSYVDTNIGDNALGGDGEKATHQRQEAEGGMTADDAAAKIHRAAERRLDFLPVAKGARLAHLLSRLSPAWLERISTKRILDQLED